MSDDEFQLTPEDRRRLADALTHDQKVAIYHADALASFVHSQGVVEAIFPYRADGAEYEITVKKKA